MRKAEVFFDAITNLKEELIDAALDYRFTRKQIHWQRYVGIAACLALVITVGFGAIRLGIIGGMGGSSNNSASMDTAAPESSANTSATTDSGSASGSTVEDSDATQSVEMHTFGAIVLEISEKYLLVEPLAGESILASADRIVVSVSTVESLPNLTVGDQVVITYDGFIRESYPAQVTAFDVTLILQEQRQS